MFSATITLALLAAAASTAAGVLVARMLATHRASSRGRDEHVDDGEKPTPWTGRGLMTHV